METSDEFAGESQAEDLFGMANISPRRTGLPFIVWIAQRGASHDIRVKVSKGQTRQNSKLVSVAIKPDVQVVGSGTLSTDDVARLQKWIELNRDVIVKYWDGDIEYAEDAIAAMKPIP